MYEFLSTGHIKSAKAVLIVKLSRFDSINDYVILAFELMLVTFIVVFALMLAKSILESIIVYRLHFWKHFLSSFWNIWDLAQLEVYHRIRLLRYAANNTSKKSKFLRKKKL